MYSVRQQDGELKARIYHSNGEVTITGDGLQILFGTHAHVSSEGSLASYAYCDTRHPFKGHLRGPVTPTPVPKRVAVELSLTVLTTWVCGERESNTQPFACEANALYTYS